MLLEYINIVNGTIIKLPIKNITTPLTINWGDGSSSETNITTNNPSHTYTSDLGTIQVSIVGNFTHFGTDPLLETIEGIELLSIVISFNITSLNSLRGAFYNATSLIEVPTTLPSTVTNLDYLFFNATSFNQNIFVWNITNVTTLNFILYGATSFNQPITGWLLNKILTFP